METTDSKTGLTAQAAVSRRAFIRTTGLVAAAAGGIEGILAARQAPAFAQGTKLHIVRWVDFIPEADVQLKRQMPEAGKALGAEIVLETINANDVQPRITAAIQSGAGADLFMLFYNWPQLYQNSLVDMTDVATPIGKDQGGFYDVFRPSFQVGSKWMGMPHSIVGNAIAYRKSLFKEIGFDGFPKTWDDLRKATTQLKKKGRPYGQTLGHTFGDAPTWRVPPPLVLRRRRDRPVRQEGRHQQQGHARVDQVHAGAVEGGLRRGRPRVGRHEQQPRVPRGRHLRDAERRVDLHRREAPEGQDQGRQGRAVYLDIDHALYPLAGAAGQFPLYFSNGHGLMKYSKNPKLAKDFLRWLHKPEHYDRWFQVCDGYSVAATTQWEKNAMWERIDKPLQMFRTAARNTRIFAMRARRPARRRRRSRSTSWSTCTRRPSRA